MKTADGRVLAWREVGSGPPLLVHPGGPGASSRYFGELPELAAQRTLILLDPRGTGDSDRPEDPTAYDLDQYATDIEAVREELGLERLDLLGHSHGGFVAMTWAGTHPDQVGRLVLASTTPRFTDALRRLRTETVAMHQGQPYFEDAVAALEAQQAGRYSTDEELGALYERAGPLLARPDEDITQIGDAFRATGINCDVMRHFNHTVASSMDLRPLLARIDAPTLVIAGEYDPFGGAANEIAAALADPTMVTVPGVGHFPFVEPRSRALWSRAVLEFLAA